MAKKEDKKIVKIEENPAPKTPETPADNGQTPKEDEVKYTFGYCLRHPIKAAKHAFEEHPVVSGAVGVTLLGGVALGVKALVDSFNSSEETEEEDDVLDDPLEDVTEEDDEETEI